MPVIVIVLLAWFALDAVLLGGWLAVAARCKRAVVRDMVRAAERYANLTRSNEPKQLV